MDFDFETTKQQLSTLGISYLWRQHDGGIRDRRTICELFMSPPSLQYESKDVCFFGYAEDELIDEKDVVVRCAKKLFSESIIINITDNQESIEKLVYSVGSLKKLLAQEGYNLLLAYQFGLVYGVSKGGEIKNKMLLWWANENWSMSSAKFYTAKIKLLRMLYNNGWWGQLPNTEGATNE